MPPDFKEMQSQAIRYAQEMHKKAETQSNTRTDDFNAINSLFNSKSTKTYNNPGFNIKSLFSATDQSENKDNDFLLIFALILLLSKDGGDKMLMLALLYILT